MLGVRGHVGGMGTNRGRGRGEDGHRAVCLLKANYGGTCALVHEGGEGRLVCLCRMWLELSRATSRLPGINA